MKRHLLIDRAWVALVVILSLASLWLVLNTPAIFLDTRAVYQGF